MRLICFYVKEFRVLKEVEVNFNKGGDTQSPSSDVQQGYNLDFLVGVNGTGKSTILRLIARVFAQLRTQEYSFPVGFELEYAIQTTSGEQLVRISNMDRSEEDQPLQPKFTWCERKTDIEDWGESNDTGIRKELLPNHIVIYTTGDEEIWLRDLFAKPSGTETTTSDKAPEDVYMRELPGHKQLDDVNEDNFVVNLDDPFLFIQSKRLSLVTLCGLLASLKRAEDAKLKNSSISDKDANLLSKVLQEIGLKGLTAFSLRLRAYPDLTHPAQQESIDRLAEVADRQIYQGADTLLLFDVQKQLDKHKTDPSNSSSIFDIFGAPIEFFQRLHILYEHQDYYDPPLQEVNIFLQPLIMKKKTDVEEEEAVRDILLFDWLSDGERSFLARMALFALFNTGNMLIILDEPEVHFNDVWKREIVNILDTIMRANGTDSRAPSHALITTHSSIALTDVRREDILVLHKRSELEEGKDAITHPNIITLGADPSDILVHVFGSRSATGERSINFIRDRIGRSNSIDELQQLKKIVAHGYWRYRIELEERRISS